MPFLLIFWPGGTVAVDIAKVRALDEALLLHFEHRLEGTEVDLQPAAPQLRRMLGIAVVVVAMAGEFVQGLGKMTK